LVAELRYLVDVFTHLNELYVNLQKEPVNVIKAQEKIDTIIKKLGL
jgi:hypothetical protein